MSKYKMPAEWQEHERCWMAWPCNDDLWPSMQRAESAYATVANAINQFEPLTMLVRPGDVETARAILAPSIELLPVTLDDSWMRDFGPTFVVDIDNQQKTGINWQFNGWGMRFPCDNDKNLATLLLDKLAIGRVDSSIVNEGGAIHVDGEGTCLLTENVQLNPNRNLNHSREDIEAEIARCLGIDKFIWFPIGLTDDHTDGHVDQFACFFKAGGVLALTTDDKSDNNYDRLQTNLEILRSSTDAKGRALKVVEVPQPQAEWDANGDRLGKSYINFYIANGGVIIPGYGDQASDLAASRIIAECFPDRRLVQIDCQEIVLGGGNIHCITQQEPEIH
jgi:agmatine deiminase